MNRLHELEEAVHNFVIAMTQQESKKYAVDYLRKEINEISEGTKDVEEKLTLGLTTKEDILEMLDELITYIKSPDYDKSHVLTTAVDLRAFIRRI